MKITRDAETNNIEISGLAGSTHVMSIDDARLLNHELSMALGSTSYPSSWQLQSLIESLQRVWKINNETYNEWLKLWRSATNERDKASAEAGMVSCLAAMNAINRAVTDAELPAFNEDDQQ